MPQSAAAPITAGSIAQVKAGDLSIGSDAARYWLTQSGQSFALKNNAGTIKLIVGQDGNVGIGTTAPAAKLAIGGIGSSGDTIAAYANSANSALYAEQTGAGYAGYFKGDVNITRNLFVGGNINATGTINSATALCVNSVCASSTAWNAMVGGGGGGNIGAFLGFNSLMDNPDLITYLAQKSFNSWSAANYDPLSHSLLISLAQSDAGYIGDHILASLLRLEKDNVSNKILVAAKAHDHSYTGGNGLSKVPAIRVGNYIYYGFVDSYYESFIKRCTIDFGSCTEMSTPGWNDVDPYFSDGTYLYANLDDGINKFARLQISGSSLIFKGYINLPMSYYYASDGTYFYAYASGKIKRYNDSGTILKEWTVGGVKDFFYISGNHFIAGSFAYSDGGTSTDPYNGKEYRYVSTIGLNLYDLGAVD